MTLGTDAEAAVTEYYRKPREELFDLLPPAPRRVLDVGCGEGTVGAEVKRLYPFCEVIGLEMNEDVAAIARTRLDDVLVGDVERLAIEVDGAFDAILYGDVLEHCIDPWAVLRGHTELLADGGRVVVSLPNVRHWAVILGLLRGAWEYQDAGILDRGHLRFFTRREGEKLLAQAGLRVRGVRPVYWQPVPDVPPGVETVSVQLEEFHVGGIRVGEFAELFAGQMIYVGERVPIVVPWDLPGGRRFHLLAWPVWGSPSLRAVLEAYCAAFEAGDDVALVLPGDGEAAARVRAELAAIGRTPESTADVIVAPMEESVRHRLLRTAHAVVRTGAPDEPDAEMLRQSGAVSVSAEVAALRATWMRARGRNGREESHHGVG